LSNGHLLLRAHPPRDPGITAGFPGGAAALLELDWDSQVVWEYRNPMMHLDFERLPNGNTLVLQWSILTPELTSAIHGGYKRDDDPDQMLGDMVSEVTNNGTVVWEWRSWEHLSLEVDVICPLENRREWTHQNAVNVTAGGDMLVSFRKTSTVGIVDRASGAFRWKWGPGVISHQHYPVMLDNGNVLLFDNGSHGYGLGVTCSRVIEVDPATNDIAWDYRGDPPFAFYSPVISGAERLPNGNTLICEGSAGRLFEVTANKEVVWEYINPFFTVGAVPSGGGPLDMGNSVFRAHRYGPDHPALKGKDMDPSRYSNLNRLYARG
jgi:hypothetical protein